MNYRSLLVVALAAVVPAMACAKKPKKGAEPVVVEVSTTPVVEEAEPVITEECVINVSLFHESVKNKQFADAYGPWWETYTTCPNANKTIYTDGVKIVEYLYANATDEAEKVRLANLAIEMQDKRIKYFGNDPKYPTAYVLGEKGLAYCDFFGESKIVAARECLRQSVEGMKEGSKIQVLVKLVDVAYALYKQNQNAEQFISDYELASTYLAMLAVPGQKNADVAAKQKDYVDNIFAISGAADCSKLDEIYAQVVNDNKSNLDMLGKIAKLYKRVKCTESDVYFAACEYSHKLQPTEESAAGCARMASKKGDLRQAIEYFQQAVNMAETEEDKADYLYNIALTYYNLKSYSSARDFARQSINAKSDQGRCYILIGLCYASSQIYGNDSKGAILNKTVYWAAVDKFVKAKQVDPSCAADADKLIAAYSKYFPTKENMFDLPNELGGATFYVGGWIGETTTCRAGH